MSEHNKSPYTIIRHRVPEGTIRHSDRIPRYWKSKQTGATVEVRRYLHIEPDKRKRVVFYDETVKHELSCFLEEFKRDFEPIGNSSDKF